VGDLAFLQTMHALTGSPVVDGNRVEVLRNGVQIFPSMLAAIRAAQKTINMEFYIYWDGDIGRQFAEALAERARAGVQIKIILDSVGSSTMSQSLIDFMARNGIDMEWYHPLRWYTLSRFNHRTHRKLMVVDGCVGFSGGIGIADEWLGDADSKDHWRDTVARIEGPAVTAAVRVHGQLSRAGRALPASRLLSAGRAARQTPHAGDQVIAVGGKLGDQAALHRVDRQCQMISISNAYSFRFRHAAGSKRGAARRRRAGDRASEHVDHPSRQASRMLYDRMLRRGIRIFEYRPTMMHAKTRWPITWSTIGSSNFDDRSFRRTTR
jgi:cardiolipin synthase